MHPDQINGGIASLDPGDAHHLRVVLKAEMGDSVLVLNGTGDLFRGKLSKLNKTNAEITLHGRESGESEPDIHITVAQALTKIGDRLEQVLQHGTEIGAARFWIFESMKSLGLLQGDRQDKKLARWKLIIKTAAEQSHRMLLPEVKCFESVDAVLAASDQFDLVLMPHPAQNPISLKRHLRTLTKEPKSILVIIGPESGFTALEVAHATTAGAKVVSLGPRILRTETAALAVLSQLMYALDDTPN